MPWSLGEILSLAAIVALLGGVVIAWVLIWNRRIRSRLAPVARGLGLEFAEVGGRESPYVLRGDWSGAPVRIQYQVGGRGERDRIRISLEVPCPVPAPVRFRRETLLHRVVKAIGLTHEPEAGDLLFDPQVFADSDRDDVIPDVIADYRVRESILRLLSRNRRSLLSLGPQAAGYTVPSHLGWGDLFHPAAIEAILGELRGLVVLLEEGNGPSRPASVPPRARSSTGMPGAAAQRVRGRAKPGIPPPLTPGSGLEERFGALGRAPSGLILVLGCLLMFVGPLLLLVGLRYPTLGWRLEFLGLAASGLLLIPYSIVAYRRMRGRTRSHSDLSVFLFAGTIGIPTFAVGGLLLANGLLDGGEPIRVTAEIVSASAGSDGDRGPRAQVLVPMGDDFRRASVAVPPVLLGGLTPGGTLVLRVAPGALGEPRLLGVEGTAPM